MGSDSHKEYCRKYYQDHKEELKAKARARNALRKAEQAEYEKKYYEANKEARRAYSKAYYQAHKDDIRARQYIYYQKHMSKTTQIKERHLGGLMRLSKEVRKAVKAFLGGKIREKKLLVALKDASAEQGRLLSAWEREASGREGR